MEHRLCDGVTGVTITLPPNLARFEESKMSKYEDPYPSLPNPLARNERTFGKAQKAVPPGFPPEGWTRLDEASLLLVVSWENLQNRGPK